MQHFPVSISSLFRLFDTASPVEVQRATRKIFREVSEESFRELPDGVEDALEDAGGEHEGHEDR